MALPQNHRLKHRQEFSAVYRLGLRRSTSHIVLRALRTKPGSAVPIDSAESERKAEPLPPTRIGISVSQKVSKRAVVRNRIKRRLRAGFRQLLPQIPAGWQIVIVVRPEAIWCDYEQFLRELKQLLIEAEVIHGHSRGDLL